MCSLHTERGREGGRGSDRCMHLPPHRHSPPYLATPLSPLYRFGRRRVCERASVGVTNRFAPLNEGGLFTSCIGIVRIGEGRRKAGNDSEMKQHSCGPDDRPMCVWVEIAIGSAGESRPPPSLPLSTLSQRCIHGSIAI